jgi:predicted phosphodiesterase
VQSSTVAWLHCLGRARNWCDRPGLCHIWEQLVKIALISDTHLAAAARDFVANCEAALTWIDENGIELVIHLGDITADGINGSEQFAFARNVLGRLRTPLRLVPGNHDVGDNPLPGIEPKEALLQPPFLDLYRRTFGPDYWLLQTAGWSLIGLNGLLFGLGDAEEAAQFKWLDEALVRISGPIGLMLHKPLFRNRPDDDELHSRYVSKPVRTRLLARLRGHDLRFVVCGHTHQLRRHRVEAVEYVWAPSTAFIVPDTLQERIGDKVVGVMILTINSQGHHFEFHTPAGVGTHDLSNYEAVFPQLRALREAGGFAREP